ncbi:MAG TPA: hypothetical protein VF330_37030 [Lentzea sp.]
MCRRRLRPLWTTSCDGRHLTLKVNASGAFAVVGVFDRPPGMPDYNNEGFALAAADECVSGSKPVCWADDSNDGGHALRRGTISC